MSITTRPPGRLLRQRFAYCFETPPGSDYPPILDCHEISAGRAGRISMGPGGVDRGAAVPADSWAGETLGFRFGGIAYSPDVSDLPEESLELSAGSRRVDHRCAPLHAASQPFLASSEALAWIERVKPKRAVLTHMHVDLDYETLRARAAARRRAGL